MANRNFTRTNQVVKTTVGTAAGNIGLTIDASSFFRGFKTSKRRLDDLKLEVARMTVPFYERLILRTPVWRGTARMNWYLNVDGKPNRSGNRWGGANKRLVDPEITQYANKFGKPASASKYLTNDPEVLAAGDKKMFDDGIERTPIGTQTQYGRRTKVVGQMVESAKANIKKNFKVIGGGTRSAKVSTISITNKLPYIQYLEGAGSMFGEPYYASSKAYHPWAEKIGASPFVVASGKAENPDPMALGRYRQGFIKRTFAQMQGEFSKFVAKTSPKHYKIR